MADVTVTVHKSTGDYSTVQSAVDACSTLIESGSYYKVEITDAATYTETVTVGSGEITTPTSSHYLWITATGAARHDGTKGSGCDIDGGFVVQLDFTRIEWMDLAPTSTVNFLDLPGNVGDVVLSHTLAYGLAAYRNSIVLAGGNGLSIDNSVIWSGGGGSTIFHFGTTLADTTVNIDHCVIAAQVGAFANIGSRWSASTSATATWNIYNSAVFMNDGSAERICDVHSNYSKTSTSVPGNHAFDGDNNCFYGGDKITGTSSTETFASTQAVTAYTATTTTADAMIYTSVTADAQDFTPVAATGGGANDLLTNGVNRQGSEPDARQDFSTDIAGNSRPTTNVDIGAFQVSSAGGSVPVTRSATLAGAASVTAAGTRTGKGAATLAGVATLTADGTGSGTVSGAATLSAAASVTVDGTRTGKGAAALQGVATLTADGTATGTVSGAATLAGAASVTVAGTRTGKGAATLTGVATLTADGSGSATVSGAASLSASATLTAAGTRTATGASVMAAAASVAAAGTRAAKGAAALAGSAVVAAAGTATRKGAALLEAAAAVSVEGFNTTRSLPPNQTATVSLAVERYTVPFFEQSAVAEFFWEGESVSV